MRVISQNGKSDIPYEHFVFSIVGNGNGYSIVATKNIAESPEVFVNSIIATYSTEEKAKKAMKMLRLAYENNEFYHHAANSEYFVEVCNVLSKELFKKSTSEYFQFPAEEELE